MTRIRVAHVVNSTFGMVFNGHSHYLFSLLSGWKDPEISFGLLGTQLKVTNINSGNRSYILSKDSHPQPNRDTRLGRFFQILKTSFLLISQVNRYDIFHFTGVSWGAMLSPLVLHLFGKKVVFSMVRYGNDNPSYILSTVRGRILLNLLRKFDGVIGLAPVFAEECKNFQINCHVITLPNFMAIPQLEKEKGKDQIQSSRYSLQIPSDAFTLLYVGVAHKRKGLDVLVDAFIELSSKHSNMRLIIIGPKDNTENEFLEDDFIPNITKKITDAKLEKQVVWTGIISDLNELTKYYWASDIFVLPTRSEGMPNVLIEALYSGLPVIISYLPGITDTVIKDGENGFLIPVNDVNGFVESIELLINDQNLNNKMSKNSRQKAVELFGFDQHCTKLKNFYVEVMK